jgi:hypothetical protein
MKRLLGALLEGRLAATIDTQRDVPFAILHWLAIPQPDQPPYFVTFHGSPESVARARRRWKSTAPRKQIVSTVELNRSLAEQLRPGDQVPGGALAVSC